MKNKARVIFFVCAALVGFFGIKNYVLAANPVLNVVGIAKNTMPCPSPHCGEPTIEITWTLASSSVYGWTQFPYYGNGNILDVIPFVNHAPPATGAADTWITSNYLTMDGYPSSTNINGYIYTGITWDERIASSSPNLCTPTSTPSPCWSEHNPSNYIIGQTYSTFFLSLPDWGYSNVSSTNIDPLTQNIYLTFTAGGKFSTQSNSYQNDTQNYGGIQNQGFVSLAFPLANSSTTDFNQWSVNYNSLAPQNQIFVWYQPLIFTSTTWSDFTTNTVPANNSVIWIPKSHALPPNLYRVWIEMIGIDLNENILFDASSSPITFSIGAGPPPIITIPTITIDCSGTISLLGFNPCEAAVYLFIPKTESFSQFSALFSQLQNKPPFGYFSAIQSAIATLNASSTPAFSLPNLSGFDTLLFNPIKAGLDWILWILFGFWIFKKFRHIQL